MGGKGSSDNNAGKITEQMAKQYYDETQPLRSTLIGNYQNFLGVPMPGSAGTPASRQPIYETRMVPNPDYGPSNNWDMGTPQMIYKRVVSGYRDVPATPAAGGEGQPPMPYDVTRNPVWGAGRNVIENQYDVAKQNTLSNIPRGGALVDTLADVDKGRAQALGGLAGQISQDEYNKVYGMATGAPGQAMNTMSNLAGQQAMAASQEQAGKAGAFGDLGLGAGMVLAEKA